MNHPKREEWVLYLYDETEPQTRAEMHHHLSECGECRAHLAEWAQSVRLLDRWRLPRRARKAEGFQPVVTWAVAFTCVALLAAGFFAGRLSFAATRRNYNEAQLIEKAKQQLRAEFAQTMSDEISRAAAAMLAESAEQTQALLVDYNQNVEARLQLEKKQRLAACLSLKRDVDTLAINADAGLQTAEQRLAQLANLRIAQTSSTQDH